MSTNEYPLYTVQDIVRTIREQGFTPTDKNNKTLYDNVQIILEIPDVIKIRIPRFKEYFGGLFGRLWLTKVAIIEVQRDSDNPQWFVKIFTNDRKVLNLLLNIQRTCNIQLTFI